MDIGEIFFELIMEVLLIYVTFLFWQSWRQTRDRGMLLLTWTFAVIFVAHTVFALILEDILGYGLPAPLEAHHILFVGLLLVIIYIQKQRQWRAGLRATPKVKGEKAA